ncbi:phospholipid transfer protein-like [Cyprinodon tularosa]|uniref:phospholipid transfer protein-like n=1 Tax=Cyprinodon tularosa TaxID=77115 RepID=UPI0018E20807|nr:phospholipid transfer protein-like [Cyprinodon tularosa]
MTSFMCPFLFLLLIFSSISAINPPGFKVRITNRALNTLRDEAQALIQEQVVGKTFESIDFLNVHLRNLRFTEVTMNRVHLQFVENYGFRLVIEDFRFTMNCDSTVNFYVVQPSGSATLATNGASATMEVGLTRTADGRLEAAMRNCKVSTNQLQIVGTGLPRIAEGALEKLLIYLVCTLINRKGISALNSYLSTAPMVADVFPDLGIKLDYSLTRDIQVTTQSLDMSFKGQAYVQNQPPLMEKGGVEPVFKENNIMAYVGITEFFFNSAARSFYDAGIMSKKFEIKSKIGKAALRIIQFFTEDSIASYLLQNRRQS